MLQGTLSPPMIGRIRRTTARWIDDVEVMGARASVARC
jgi:hypothetical protein